MKKKEGKEKKMIKGEVENYILSYCSDFSEDHEDILYFQIRKQNR